MKRNIRRAIGIVLIFAFAFPVEAFAWGTFHDMMPGWGVELMEEGPLKEILKTKIRYPGNEVSPNVNHVGHSCDNYHHTVTTDAGKPFLVDGSLDVDAVLPYEDNEDYRYLLSATNGDIGYVGGHVSYQWDWYVRDIQKDLRGNPVDPLKIALKCAALTHFLEFQFPEKAGEYGGIDTKFRRGELTEAQIMAGYKTYLNTAGLQWGLDTAMENIFSDIILNIAPWYVSHNSNNEHNYQYFARQMLLLTVVYNEIQRQTDPYYDKNPKDILFVNRSTVSLFEYRLYTALAEEGYSWECVTGDYIPNFYNYPVVFINEGWKFNNTEAFYDALEQYVNMGGHVMIKANPNTVSSWEYTPGPTYPDSYTRLLASPNVDQDDAITGYQFYGKTQKYFRQNMNNWVDGNWIPPINCRPDTDNDGDVDGADLASIAASDTDCLAEFAASFGQP